MRMWSRDYLLLRNTWVYPYFFNGVHFAGSLVFCILYCSSLFVILPVFYLPLTCLPLFDFMFLITPLVSSNLFKIKHAFFKRGCIYPPPLCNNFSPFTLPLSNAPLTKDVSYWIILHWSDSTLTKGPGIFPSFSFPPGSSCLSMSTIWWQYIHVNEVNKHITFVVLVIFIIFFIVE